MKQYINIQSMYPLTVQNATRTKTRITFRFQKTVSLQLERRSITSFRFQKGVTRVKSYFPFETSIKALTILKTNSGQYELILPWHISNGFISLQRISAIVHFLVFTYFIISNTLNYTFVFLFKKIPYFQPNFIFINLWRFSLHVAFY